ncbi:hypothetical protein [Myroides odoratus]|uniref:Beta-lactamase-inhibitor-like PepSY-like domain-containing protein n=1 Tax=Myroides odoratus TaxID=256 RepID=A0A378RK80_MYROD|nr:hypothetical protein [Myroides odoratus]QQU02310.1 hypothetical protein I6I89_10605 [Myroides odoratus]STZ26759.1 Uncharacterised protein [Myroides odoratus]
MKKRTIIRHSVLVFALVFLSSCTDFLKSIEATKNGSTTSQSVEGKEQVVEEELPIETAAITQPQKKTEFAAHRADLQEVETALRNLPQLKDKPIYVYQSIHFYDNHRVLLQIQNPDNANYVDEYYYVDGHWQEPKPIVLSKHTKVKEDVVSLDEIPFVHANNVYEALKEKVEEIGGNPSDLTVYVITRKNRVRWYPRTISNERARYSIEFKKDGTLLSFEQD